MATWRERLSFVTRAQPYSIAVARRPPDGGPLLPVRGEGCPRREVDRAAGSPREDPPPAVDVPPLGTRDWVHIVPEVQAPETTTSAARSSEANASARSFRIPGRMTRRGQYRTTRRVAPRQAQPQAAHKP